MVVFRSLRDAPDTSATVGAIIDRPHLAPLMGELAQHKLCLRGQIGTLSVKISYLNKSAPLRWDTIRAAIGKPFTLL